jgi:hypothetical protein
LPNLETESGKWRNRSDKDTLCLCSNAEPGHFEILQPGLNVRFKKLSQNRKHDLEMTSIDTRIQVESGDVQGYALRKKKNRQDVQFSDQICSAENSRFEIGSQKYIN